MTNIIGYDYLERGKDLSLFCRDHQVGKDLILYTPLGTQLRYQLEQHLKSQSERENFQFILSPHIVKTETYQNAGVEPDVDGNFAPSMVRYKNGGKDIEDSYTLNNDVCIQHCVMYKANKHHSYTELSWKLSEVAATYLCVSNTIVGATSDYHHIFCEKDNIVSSIFECVKLFVNILSKYTNEKLVIWVGGNCQKTVEEVCKLVSNISANIEVKYCNTSSSKSVFINIEVPDIYGCLSTFGKIWHDDFWPSQLDLHYVGQDGNKHLPALIHASCFGNLEHFLIWLIDRKKYDGFELFAISNWWDDVPVLYDNVSLVSRKSTDERLLNGHVRIKYHYSGEEVVTDVHNVFFERYDYEYWLGWGCFRGENRQWAGLRDCPRMKLDRTKKK